MVEDIECVHAELHLNALSDSKVFHQRSVREEHAGSVEAVESDISELATAGHRESRPGWACQRTSISPRREGRCCVRHRRNRCEERHSVSLRIEAAGPDVE